MRYLNSPSTLCAAPVLWPARTDARAVFEVLLATAELLAKLDYCTGKGVAHEPAAFGDGGIARAARHWHGRPIQIGRGKSNRLRGMRPTLSGGFAAAHIRPGMILAGCPLSARLVRHAGRFLGKIGDSLAPQRSHRHHECA